MLIDINAYIGHWPFKQLKYNTCKALLHRMDRFGVDVSVISSLNGIFYKNTQSANEELYNEIRTSKKFYDRFIPFGVINPVYAGWQDDLITCKNKFGMKGIRLYPKYHNYGIHNKTNMTKNPQAEQKTALVELVLRARDLGMTIAFTLRMVDSRQRSWMDIDYVPRTDKPEWVLKDVVPIIKAVPDAKYMILNVCNSMALNNEEMTVFNEANILMDTSGRSIFLERQLQKWGRQKFAFGTHSPILDYLTGQLRIKALRESEADNETIDLIESGNAKNMLAAY